MEYLLIVTIMFNELSKDANGRVTGPAAQYLWTKVYPSQQACESARQEVLAKAAEPENRAQFGVNYSICKEN